AVFQVENLNPASLGMNHPDFGDANAGVVGQLFLALPAYVSGREDLHDQLRRGMDITVALHNRACLKDCKIWRTGSKWVPPDDQAKFRDHDRDFTLVGL